MFRFLRLLVVAVIAIVLVAFCFANRQPVTVSFDPFSTPDNAAVATQAPLFVVVVVVAMLAVIAGALATWVSQGRHRKAARVNRREAAKWRSEAQTLKAAQPAGSALTRT
ncbi:uncharacterized protein DUF1049 [Roseiarcus fermentans]|uniref:Uncharacterized protein DUF1049 n=1 Tax=Roseiarcus fermentans TaxID=1473586 RepID=A0A366FUA2_9HYPH|nr:lipopolysaccharide assembly protein LapA domain-containing protein [Roseiarcus fermentans]RBP18252.1 uncharacterized protein DUF1049 [Roseiarcus fermentans]